MPYSRIRGSQGRIRASKVLWGWVLVGWGTFNVTEGLLDHHVLTGEFQTLADLLFLIFGVLLIAGGWALQRTGQVLNLTADDRRRLPAADDGRP